jgi:periplasmic copper chaperone A
MKALGPLLVLLLATACGAPQQHKTDHAAPSNELHIEQPWAAPTLAGVDVSAGYLVIDNETASDDRLLSATSPRAERVEIHDMTLDGAVMQMRPVERLTIPAGQTVTLAPGGMHLMFYGVAEPFAEGQNIPLQLTFGVAGTIDVTLPVRRALPETHSDGH